MSQQASDGWYPVAPPETGVWGRFEWVDVIDVEASKQADEYRYKKIPALRSRAAGAIDESVEPVKPFNQEKFIRRFPEAWRYFQGEMVQAYGTPLEEMEFLEQERLQFQMYGVHSIEQLSTLSDDACSLMGFGTRKNREKAKAFLQKKRDDALNVVVAEQIEKTERRKPGRPKKVQNAAAVSTAA